MSAKIYDLNEIEAAAGKATPGPWIKGEKQSDTVIVKQGTRYMASDAVHWYGGTLVCESASPANRDYIAAANPAALLAMIRDLRRYEKALRFYDDFACCGHLVAVKADGGKIAQAALAGDSAGATATGSAEPDAEGKA